MRFLALSSTVLLLLLLMASNAASTDPTDPPTDPTDPPTDPTDPPTDPTDPPTDPTDPPTDPTDPPTDPTDPPTDPTDPPTDPTDPPTDPTDPPTDPTDPPTDPTDPPTDPTDPPTDPTDPLTDPTDPPTDPTDPPTDPTDPPTNPTDPPTEPTDPPTDPTDPPTDPTDPPTDPTDPPTDPPIDPPTTVAPLDLFKMTDEQLKLINEILDNFLVLVKTFSKVSSAARRVRGSRVHPAAWWRAETAPPRETLTFCVEAAQDDGQCHQLEKELEETNDLVVKLESNVETWTESDLTELNKNRENLDGMYVEINGKPDTFKDEVIVDQFTTVIEEVHQTVEKGSTAVQEKIDQLEPGAGEGSVALVAVLGTLGGLMIVALVGVMAYRFVKKPKTKKETPDTSYDKVQQENIPIGTLSQEGPAPRQPPRMDPYSQAPLPQQRRDPSYATSYGPRSETNYGPRSESNYGPRSESNYGPRSEPRQGGLPRTDPGRGLPRVRL